MPEIVQLKALETALHQPDIRRDSTRLAALLSEDFTEFGSSGRRFDRVAILAALQAEEENDHTVESDSYQLYAISDDAALLTYRSFHRFPDGSTTAHCNRSSLWQRIDGNWRMRFHQGTPAAR
ncbi:DUF4440 domain-containing protein [Martelella limonii]|uniref:nuclear transport factor 2 family protein n=1 Tax=Martelella limonii TaxID=1647649 RepID=UPI001580072E|nr:nuclear transport factor 2 family protein [Martelella limonii]